MGILIRKARSKSRGVGNPCRIEDTNVLATDNSISQYLDSLMQGSGH